MPPHRASLATVLAMACAAGACAHPEAASSPPRIIGHPIRVDGDRRLLSWWGAGSPYAHVARLAWTALETKFPVQDNGLETYLAFSRFDPEDFEGVSWPHNPAGLYAMLSESAVLWYEFSGDDAAVALVRKALDHQLDHGTTPRDWDWARVPYASAGAGDVDYGGADDEWCDFCGRGDGLGVIEPDKVGELGYAYLRFYELTGEARYRDAAVACADALASHVREDADERRSPWPFRVYALTNVPREEYSANVVGAIMLFDELDRLSLGDDDAYRSARAVAFDWLMRVPMKNDAWSGYFEDIAIQTDPQANPNQYIALRTARWLLEHPQDDARWRDHVAHLLAWAVQTFGVDTATERGTQWGAIVMSEQANDMAKMGSHTARLGAVTALWSAATGDAAARARAARSLNWATYTCDERGVVAVGEDKNEGWWFSDGYGDYIRQFLLAMAAVPDWAPQLENHLLRSTSVVTHVDYAPARIAWSTFDADATETLRLTARPNGVTVGGDALAETADLGAAGYTVRPLPSGGVVVRVRHTTPGEIVVTTSVPARIHGEADGDDAVAGATVRAPAGAGCATGTDAPVEASVVALGALAAVAAAARRRRSARG